MTGPSRGNASRQRRHRERQLDAGKVRLSVWVEFEALDEFREIARQRGLTLDEATSIAVAHWAGMMRRLLTAR